MHKSIISDGYWGLKKDNWKNAFNPISTLEY